VYKYLPLGQSMNINTSNKKSGIKPSKIIIVQKGLEMINLLFMIEHS